MTMTKCLLRDKNTDTDAERRRSREDKGRNWGDAAASQGMSGATRSQKRPERVLLRAAGGSREGPADTVTSDSWPPELWENTFP